MADVRLTATNPADSSVVPVACNAQGELLIEGGGGGDFPGNITVAGTGSFGSTVYSNTWFQSNRTVGSQSCFVGNLNGSDNVNITAGGSATFALQVLAGSSPNQGSGTGVRIDGENGGILASSASGGNTLFKGFQAGSNTVTSQISAAGDANFVGNVTAANITTFTTRIEQALSEVNDIESLKAALLDAISGLKGL